MAQLSLRPWHRRDLQARLVFAGTYLALATGANLIWELAQLPLYTIWTNAPLGDSLLASVHCTAGDILIAALALALAILLGGRHWPNDDYVRVCVLTVTLGVAYTVFSEWLNLEIRGAWAYAPAMPRLPWTGTGLAPLAQWIVIPTASFLLLRNLASSARNNSISFGATSLPTRTSCQSRTVAVASSIAVSLVAAG